jgi:hypothetical protein
VTDATATTRRRRPPAPVSISEQAQRPLNTAPPLDQVQQPEPDPEDTRTGADGVRGRRLTWMDRALAQVGKNAIGWVARPSE